MFTTLLAVNAVSLVAVLAFARWNTLRVTDAPTDWQQAVVPAASEAARV